MGKTEQIQGLEGAAGEEHGRPLLRGEEVASYTGLPDVKEALEMAFEAGLGALIQSRWCTADGYTVGN